MKKALLLLAVSLGCISCAPIPFDLSLSQAQFTAGRMLPMAGVGPLDTKSTHVGPGSLLYLPDRTGTAPGLRFDRGFIVSRDSYNISIFFAVTKADGTWAAYQGWGDSQINSDGFIPSYQIQTVKAPSPDSAAVIKFDNVSPERTFIAFGQGNEAGQGITITGANSLQGQLVTDFGLSTSSVAIGGSFRPTASSLADQVQFLVRESPGSYREVQWDVSTTLGAPAFIRPSAVALPFLDSRNQSLYYYCSKTGYSYAGFFDQVAAAWHYWRWDSSLAPVPLSRIPGRIDAVLTTGELLTNEAGFSKVFDPDGKLLASFPEGSLTFLFEAFLNTTPYVFFSQSYLGGNELYFGIYAIATSDVKTLAW